MFTELTIGLEAEGASAAEGRRCVRRFLVGKCGPEERDTASLIVSELVTNAVLHGRPPIRLGLFADTTTLRIEVFDSNGERDGIAARPPEPRGVSGRGLTIVAALAASWGVRPHAGGKCVWADVPLAQLAPEFRLDEHA